MPTGRLRARVILLAVLLLPINAWWIMQTEVVRYAGHPTTTSLFYNTVFWLCALIAGNSLTKRVAPKLALDRGELITLYAVLGIGSSLAGHDSIQVLLPILAWPVFRKDAANRWEETLVPFLPKHLVVSDPEALKNFYTGHSTLYDPDHLRAWMAPALSWCAFLTVLVALMLFTNILLRKRWTQSEKLAFPLVMLPLELTAPGAPILRNPTLWAGFATATALELWNGTATLIPSLPLIPFKYQDYGTVFTERPWNAIGWLPIGFYPFGIALGMLLPLDFLFSSWFFYLFWKAQLVTAAWTGWDREPNFPYVNAQSLGAYLGIAIGALWAARKHLAWVVAVAVGDEKETREPDDPISMRTAAWSALVCIVLLAVFAHFAGISPAVTAGALAIYLAIAVAVSRMRAELGPPVHDLHYAGPDTMLPQILGPTRFDRGDLIGLSFWWGFNRAYRGLAMPIQIEAFKMAEQARFSARNLHIALLVAGFLAPLCGFWALLDLCYDRGAAGNISPPNVLAIFGGEAWNRWNGWNGVPLPPQTPQGIAVGAGFAFTLFLNLLRGRIIGFPFHPVGYAVSSSWGMSVLWIPMLIAWIMKLAVLRYGGLALYRKWVPFFHGIILGECLTGSLWSIVGIVQDVPTYAFWP